MIGTQTRRRSCGLQWSTDRWFGRGALRERWSGSGSDRRDHASENADM